MEPLRRDDWLAELERLDKDTGPEGFSRRELEQFLGVSDKTAYTRLRKWCHKGLVAHVGFRKETGISGHKYDVPVYRVVKQEEA